MNLPTGVTRVAGKNVKTFDARKELEDLSAANFSGYVIITLFGERGIEEAALLFRSGQGVASLYEYYGLKQTVWGDDSIPHTMNAFLAEHGVLDVVELSVQQVDLVSAFNPKMRLNKPLVKGQLRGLVKDTFDTSLSQRLSANLQANAPISKESLFKKFGLAGIEGG